MTKPAIVTARLRRAPPVLVCKKCLSRVDDGKALRKTLKSELKARSAAQGTKPPRVVLTSCLGICPKRAVVVGNGGIESQTFPTITPEIQNPQEHASSIWVFELPARLH